MAEDNGVDKTEVAETTDNPINDVETDDNETTEANKPAPVPRRLSARELLELKRAFNLIDQDESGYIDVAEIKTVLQELGQDTTAEDLKDILVALDSNDDGHISFDEFKSWWQSEQHDGTKGLLKLNTIKYVWVAPALMAFHLFDDPSWFKQLGIRGMPFYYAGECIVWTINVLIVVSTLAFVFETHVAFSGDPNKNPDDWERWENNWLWTEAICVICFTIDFLVRLVACGITGELRKFSNDAMNWIDVIAVFPFYLKAIVQMIVPDAYVPDLRFVRCIRLARVLRSLPEKYAAMGSVISEIVSTAAMGLFLPLYFMFLSMFVWASLVYYAENPHHMVCRYEVSQAECDETLGTDTWSDELQTCVREHSDWDTSRNSVGNEGCLIDYGCKCMCDDVAHQFAFDHPNVGQNGYLLEGEEDNSADPVAVGAGSCIGVVQFVTWDGAEYSSDMFADATPGGIGTAMWWCVVTFTTVGYGDMNPRTPQGQFLAVLTMSCGVFFLAMPLAVVGAAFTQAWNRAQDSHNALLADREQIAAMEGLDDAQRQKALKKAKQKALVPCTMMYGEMEAEQKTRLDVLSYANRMKMLAEATVAKCPEGNLTQAREAIEAFTLKLDEIIERLDSEPEWRPRKMTREVPENLQHPELHLSSARKWVGD